MPTASVGSEVLPSVPPASAARAPVATSHADAGPATGAATGAVSVAETQHPATPSAWVLRFGGKPPSAKPLAVQPMPAEHEAMAGAVLEAPALRAPIPQLHRQQQEQAQPKPRVSMTAPQPGTAQAKLEAGLNDAQAKGVRVLAAGAVGLHCQNVIVPMSEGVPDFFSITAGQLPHGLQVSLVGAAMHCAGGPARAHSRNQLHHRRDRLCGPGQAHGERPV